MHAPPGRAGVALLVVAGLLVLALEPWRGDADPVQVDTWIPLQEAIPEISLPSELDRIEDTACRLDAEGKRVNTIVVHSATMALGALKRGRADLVIAGHLHLQVGPDRILGDNGQVDVKPFVPFDLTSSATKSR